MNILCSQSLIAKLRENISAKWIYSNRIAKEISFIINKITWVIQNGWIFCLELIRKTMLIIKILSSESELKL